MALSQNTVSKMAEWYAKQAGVSSPEKDTVVGAMQRSTGGMLNSGGPSSTQPILIAAPQSQDSPTLNRPQPDAAAAPAATPAVTDSIMRLLSPRELEAVIAHEISHVRNRDVLALTIASFMAMVAAIVMQNFLSASLFGRRDSGNSWIIAGIVAVVVYFVAQILIMALSRYREYAADRGSAYITGSPRDLSSALMKISGRMDAVPPQYKEDVETANAFFIIPALSGRAFLELFSTHPPLEKRIAALEQVELEMEGLS